MQRLPLHFFCGSVLCNVETCNFGKPERFGQVNYVRSNFRDFGMNRFFFRQLVSAASIGRDLTKLRHKSCTTEVAHARGSSFFGKCKLTMRASSTGLLPHLEQQVCKKGRAKCSLYIYIYIYLSIYLSVCVCKPQTSEDMQNQTACHSGSTPWVSQRQKNNNGNFSSYEIIWFRMPPWKNKHHRTTRQTNTN